MRGRSKRLARENAFTAVVETRSKGGSGGNGSSGESRRN